MAHLSRLLVLFTLAAIAGAVHADPVTIIGGLIAMGGASAAGITLSAVAFAGVTYGAIAFAAGSLLFGTLNAKRKQKKAAAAQRDQYNASLQDRLVTALSTAAPWQIVYGQAEVGGSLEAILTSGEKDEFKHLVIVFAAHQCEAFVDVKIAGESLGALDGSGNVTSGKWFKPSTEVHSETLMFDVGGQATISRAGGTLVGVVIPAVGGGGGEASYVGGQDLPFPGATLLGTTVSGGPVSLSAVVTYSVADGSAMVRVQKHLGSDDQLVDATLLAECADEWTADDRLRGLCYLVVRLNLTEAEFQGGPPAVTAVIKGKPVYDPRSTLTAWSDNPALCVADFLRAPYGKDARQNQVVWDTVSAAANACDEVVTVEAWTGARFRCDGGFRTDQDTDQTLDELLDCMAGWADGSGGWRIGAGVWTAPVATITDDDNAGAVQIVGGEALDELFNGMRGQYNDPQRYGVATDFVPYQNAGFVAADGRALWLDLPLPFTNNGTRARNLARIAVERARGETLSYPAKIGVVNRVRVGERLMLDCPALGIAGVAFRLQRREEQPGGPVLLTLQQDVPESYDTADAAAPISSSSSGLPDQFVVPPVTGLAASASEIYALVTTTAVIPRIFVSVAGPPAHWMDQLQLAWRTSTSDTWQTLMVPAGQMTAYIENVNQGSTYFVRARWFRAAINAASDWRVVSVAVSGKTTAPPPFDVFTVTELDSGTRRFDFAYTVTPQPVDWRGAEIRWMAGTHALPDWNAMTPLSTSGTWYTGSPVESMAPAATGDFTFACRSRDSGGLSAMKLATATLVKDGVPANKYATAYLYQWAAAAPGNPSGESTYTWATGASSAYSGGNGWSTAIPDNPGTADFKLWMASKQVTAVAAAATTAVDWTAGFTVWAGSQNAEPVYKFATSFLYQWASAQPGNPSGTSTHTWATGAGSAYSGGNGWSNTIPANPGTPLLKLWTAAKQVTDVSSAVTTEVSWAAGFSVVANSQNGAAGLQTAQPAVYQWAATIPTIAGAATYTWATSAFAAPAGWSLTIGAAPTPGYTLWKATAPIVDSATATTTAINWATAGIVASGYAALNGSNGAAGSDGLSARICFARVASNPTPVAGTIVTAGSASFPSSAQSTTTWGFAATWAASDPAPSSSNSLYQSDGIYNPATNQTSWGTPYISSLKVGSLSAISASMGALTVDAAVTVSTTGHIKGGQTDYNAGTGFWQGYSGGTYKASWGSATQGLTWDGTKLTLKGGLYVGSNNSIVLNDATGAVLIYQLTGSSSTFSNSPNPSVPCITAATAGGMGGTGQAILASALDGTDGVAIFARSRGAFASYPNAHAFRGGWYSTNAFGGTLVSSGLVGATNGKAFHAEAGTAGPFTGSHDVALPNGTEIEPGDIVVDVACLLRGDWSNTFFQVARSSTPNQVGVLGIYTRNLGPMARYGLLPSLNERTVVDDFGELCGPNTDIYDEIKAGYFVGEANALGEGQMNVCGEGGNIGRHDLIVASSTPGKGMRQGDNVVRSYTVAKAREAVTFAAPGQVKQVACIYLCG